MFIPSKQCIQVLISINIIYYEFYVYLKFNQKINNFICIKSFYIISKIRMELLEKNIMIIECYSYFLNYCLCSDLSIMLPIFYSLNYEDLSCPFCYLFNDLINLYKWLTDSLWSYQKRQFLQFMLSSHYLLKQKSIVQDILISNRYFLQLFQFQMLLFYF